MKKIIFNLLFCVISVNLIAQEAPKKSNLIIVRTTDNIDDSFKKVGRILINDGYEIETSDKNFYMITTKVRQKKYGMMGGGTLEIKLIFQIDQISDTTLIKVKGYVNSMQLASTAGMRNDSFEKSAIRIENKGANGSIIRSAWEFMDEIAKKYDAGQIVYSIEGEE